MLILYLVHQEKLGGSHMAAFLWGVCPALGEKDALVNKEYCHIPT